MAFLVRADSFDTVPGADVPEFPSGYALRLRPGQNLNGTYGLGGTGSSGSGFSSFAPGAVSAGDISQPITSFFGWNVTGTADLSQPRQSL